MHLLLRLCTTCRYQTTATGCELCSNWLDAMFAITVRLELGGQLPLLPPLLCTLYGLKYAPVVSIIGWRLREPD